MKDKTVILAILVIVAGAVGPAWNLTIEELADMTDDNLTTAFQPDLLIAAWGGVIADVALGTLLYFTRNQPNQKP